MQPRLSQLNLGDKQPLAGVTCGVAFGVSRLGCAKEGEGTQAFSREAGSQAEPQWGIGTGMGMGRGKSSVSGAVSSAPFMCDG